MTRAALALLLLVGCRSEAKPSPQPAPTTVTIGSVTVDEVRPLLPKAADFAFVRTVTDVAKSGGRAGIELCFDNVAPDEAWEQLRARLSGLGWGELFVQTRVEHGKKSLLLAARRAPFTMTGEIVRDVKPPEPGVPECSGTKGQSLVILFVHRAT